MEDRAIWRRNGRRGREIVRGCGRALGGRGVILVRWRRVINDNDLLRDTVFIEFAPICFFPPAILGRSGPCAHSGMGGSHCGRSSGRRRREDFGGLSVREGGSRRRGRCHCRRRCWSRSRSRSRRINGVRIGRCRQTSGGICSSRRGGRGSRIGGRGLVRVVMGVTVTLRMMRSRMRRSGRGRGRHGEEGMASDPAGLDERRMPGEGQRSIDREDKEEQR